MQNPLLAGFDGLGGVDRIFITFAFSRPKQSAVPDFEALAAAQEFSFPFCSRTTSLSLPK